MDQPARNLKVRPLRAPQFCGATNSRRHVGSAGVSDQTREQPRCSELRVAHGEGGKTTAFETTRCNYEIICGIVFSSIHGGVKVNENP